MPSSSMRRHTLLYGPLIQHFPLAPEPPQLGPRPPLSAPCAANYAFAPPAVVPRNPSRSWILYLLAPHACPSTYTQATNAEKHRIARAAALLRQCQTQTGDKEKEKKGERASGHRRLRREESVGGGVEKDRAGQGRQRLQTCFRAFWPTSSCVMDVWCCIHHRAFHTSNIYIVYAAVWIRNPGRQHYEEIPQVPPSAQNVALNATSCGRGCMAEDLGTCVGQPA